MEKVQVEKILGYILLAIGVGLIAYSAFDVFNVFKGKSQPHDLFSLAPVALDLSKMTDQPLPADKDLTQTLLDAETLNQPMNLVAHVVLMGFIASAGLKIAQIGTMLVRSIKVNLLRKDDVVVKNQ